MRRPLPIRPRVIDREAEMDKIIARTGKTLAYLAGLPSPDEDADAVKVRLVARTVADAVASGKTMEEAHELARRVWDEPVPDGFPGFGDL